jgi:hypothetical protein
VGVLNSKLTHTGPASATKTGSADGAGTGAHDVNGEPSKEDLDWWLNASVAEVAVLDSPGTEVDNRTLGKKLFLAQIRSQNAQTLSRKG